MVLAIFGTFSSAITLDTRNNMLPSALDSCSPIEYFNGPISKKSVAETIDKFEKCQPKKLILTSEGGDEEAAFLIVTALRKYRIELEISEVCLSACAQIVMLSTDKVIIRPLTIVGFHHSSYAINDWAIKYRMVSPIYFDIYRDSLKLSQETVRLIYSKKKLDILRYAFRYVEPKCLLPGNIASNGQWRIWMRQRFWFPRRAHLQEAGIVISTEWENIPPSISQPRYPMAPLDDKFLNFNADSIVDLLPLCIDNYKY